MKCIVILGKRFLTQILVNQPEKWYFQEKRKLKFIQLLVYNDNITNNIRDERGSYQEHLSMMLMRET